MTAAPHEQTSAYEAADANVRPLWGAGLLLAALIAASFLVGSWLLAAFDSDAEEEDRAAEHLLESYRPRPTAAVLQARPSTELSAYRRAVEAELERVGWIDREAGIVQIPVERAMELLLERGLEARLGEASSDGR